MKWTKWDHTLKQMRRKYIRGGGSSWKVAYMLCFGCVCLLLVAWRRAAPIQSWKKHTVEPIDPLLLIVIGSAPKNAHLRAAARSTWMRWIPDDGSVQYRFFSDAPPSIKTSAIDDTSQWRALALEEKLHGDLEFQALPSGYGTNELNAYGKRALYQMHWALNKFPRLQYFLRIDDDSFLCLHKLLYEIKSAPSQQFFWGKFWCREGRNRADENFMLFSADIVELLTNKLVGKLLPFDEDVTMGWNFGYWSWMLNISIFDDQTRIDAQQSYLTTYMHNESAKSDADFCDEYIYAHHVGARAMERAFNMVTPHVMYAVPERIAPDKTCQSGDRSFVPKRHSKRLPDLKIARASNALDAN